MSRLTTSREVAVGMDISNMAHQCIKRLHAEDIDPALAEPVRKAARFLAQAAWDHLVHGMTPDEAAAACILPVGVQPGRPANSEGKPS